MLAAYQETTKWVSSNTDNHIYVIDEESDKLVAYMYKGTQVVLKHPMKFDLSGRTFVKVDTPIREGLVDVKVVSKLVQVKGSKGNVYFIDPVKETCTCPGYRYRSTCRHLEEWRINNEL